MCLTLIFKVNHWDQVIKFNFSEFPDIQNIKIDWLIDWWGTLLWYEQEIKSEVLCIIQPDIRRLQINGIDLPVPILRHK